MKSAYILGTLTGIVALALAAAVIPVQWPVIPALVAAAVIYAAFGVTTGYLLPSGRWHWGIGLAVPMALVVVVSGSFASGVGGAGRGLPLLAAALVGGLLGAHLGAARSGTRQPS